ncbi:MAG: hypothetical protein OXH12_04005 [Chloroflexi bacterium]|nr:hypothetical protein [Chloroflexota bacterium]
MTEENGVGQATRKRERSSITFPYDDLSSAVGVARAVHENGGGHCQLDQLAAWLKYSAVENGAFRQKANTARIFGLVTMSRGTVELTPLGHRIVDPAQEQAARIEAFLAVPLYAKAYEEFLGKTLPSSVQGLENAFARFGVSTKQTAKARQAFQRSAKQAGFFDTGSDRLVEPSVRRTQHGSTIESEEAAALEQHVEPSTDHAPAAGQLHPLIRGLVQTLPDPGSMWSETERDQWLAAAKANFALIYKVERPALPSPPPDPVKQATA